MDEIEEEDLKSRFLSAANFLPTIVPRLNPEQLLQLYGLYKQATVGRCNTPRPNWYAIEAKRKWDAWNSLGDLSEEDSMKKYVNLISEFCPDWEEEGSGRDKSFSWISVSRMAQQEEDLPAGQRTVFDMVKEGAVEEVRRCLRTEVALAQAVDSEGMGLLHWAADRGHLPMVQLLLDHGLDKESRDADGQTPLHFACACGHLEVARLLLAEGADPTVLSKDGSTPLDLAEPQLKPLFTQ